MRVLTALIDVWQRTFASGERPTHLQYPAVKDRQSRVRVLFFCHLEDFVSVSDYPYSPGAFILEFLKLIGLEPGATGFLSCKIGRSKGIQYARPKEQVSSGTARIGVKALIMAVGLDPSKYTTHSARRGAAVAAASAGATPAELAEIGRWKSADMPLAYIRGSGKVRNAATTLVCTDESSCKSSRKHASSL
jgi:hypothetical protein